MLPTLPSLVAPDVVVMITYCAAIDEKVAMMTTFGF